MCFWAKVGTILFFEVKSIWHNSHVCISVVDSLFKTLTTLHLLGVARSPSSTSVFYCERSFLQQTWALRLSRSLTEIRLDKKGDMEKHEKLGET